MLQAYAACFAVDVLGFAVMSNHLHIVARNRPDLARGLSDEEVAWRWATLFPWRDGQGGQRPWSKEHLANLARNRQRIAQLRQRLSSLSWFMKLIKERVSRRANRENGCKGAFWEGRFRSTSLLDQGALLAAMVYVDLNPIRAGIAATPEESEYTSVRLRVATRQAARGSCDSETDSETGLWLASVARIPHVPRSEKSQRAVSTVLLDRGHPERSSAT